MEISYCNCVSLDKKVVTVNYYFVSNKLNLTKLKGFVGKETVYV